MSLSSEAVFRLADQARTVEGKNGAVIYRVDTSHWMKLNRSGSMVLGMVDGKRSVADIAEGICREHDFPQDIVNEWVTEFLSILSSKHYLEEDTGASEPAAAEAAAGITPAQDEYRLDILYLHVTGRCNFSCPYCYASAGRETPDLDLNLCRRVIARAAEIGATKLAISGGEPMLRSDLCEIIRAGKEAGLTTQLLTNGSLLTTQEKALEITRYLDLFQVSVDGWNDETNSGTRGEGTYDRVRAALGLLKEIGFTRVAAAVTPYALDESDIDQVIRLAPEMGVRLLRFNQLIPSGRAAEMEPERFSGQHAIQLADAVYKHFYQFQEETAKDGGAFEFGVKVAGDPANTVMSKTCKLSCGVGISTLSIDCDGAVYPCSALHRPELIVGNVKDEDLGAIHARSVERHAPLVVDHLEECRDCDVRHFCGGGCRAIHFAKTGRLDVRSPHCEVLRDRILSVFRRTVG